MDSLMSCVIAYIYLRYVVLFRWCTHFDKIGDLNHSSNSVSIDTSSAIPPSYCSDKKVYAMLQPNATAR